MLIVLLSPDKGEFDMGTLREKRLSSEMIYSGRILKLTKDTVQLCDGHETLREVVHHSGGVSILPIDEEGNCYLVRQFRYPAGHEVLEIPAGKREAGEEPLTCAVRELSEETGFTADSLVDLGHFYVSPGYTTELLYVYLATGLHPGKSHPDEGEFLNVEKMPFAQLLNMAMNNELEDAKTLIAVLKAARILHLER